ncbi:uncharacterized protein [Amphiura filiformis]|uniref:uncharacterized protein n=1 Tax=Amphiura filiformis TaxID=82378 RepID=UPI003B2249BF
MTAMESWYTMGELQREMNVTLSIFRPIAMHLKIDPNNIILGTLLPGAGYRIGIIAELVSNVNAGCIQPCPLPNQEGPVFSTISKQSVMSDRIPHNEMPTKAHDFLKSPIDPSPSDSHPDVENIPDHMHSKEIPLTVHIGHMLHCIKGLALLIHISSIDSYGTKETILTDMYSSRPKDPKDQHAKNSNHAEKQLLKDKNSLIERVRHARKQPTDLFIKMYISDTHCTLCCDDLVQLKKELSEETYPNNKIDIQLDIQCHALFQIYAHEKRLRKMIVEDRKISLSEFVFEEFYSALRIQIVSSLPDLECDDTYTSSSNRDKKRIILRRLHHLCQEAAIDAAIDMATQTGIKLNALKSPSIANNTTDGNSDVSARTRRASQRNSAHSVKTSRKSPTKRKCSKCSNTKYDDLLTCVTCKRAFHYMCENEGVRFKCTSCKGKQKVVLEDSCLDLDNIWTSCTPSGNPTLKQGHKQSRFHSI